jgi:hypothetical protein
MDKEAILRRIENIKKVHKNNFTHVEFLIKGLPLKDEPVALSPYECQFGQWLYGDAQELIDNLGKRFYDEIEAIHIQWHEEYRVIYNIYFDRKKSTLFGKLFSKYNTPNQMDQEKAKAHLDDLEQTTKNLLKKMDALMRRINAVSFE